MKIARRFDAGLVRFKNHRVPEGRKKIRFKGWIFCRPSGTCLYSRLNPALKRRAIFTMSLRDKPLPEFPRALVLSGHLSGRCAPGALR